MYSKKDYTFLRFEKSKRAGKKYDAVLRNKKTKREVRVPFGSITYQQYSDNTGLGLYSSKNHGDKKRRALYRARHKNDNLNDYSPGYFSWRFLWT